MKENYVRLYRVKNKRFLDCSNMQRIKLTCDELLFKRIVLIDFKIWELQNYLKSNPQDKKAKENLDRYSLKQRALKYEYYKDLPNFNSKIKFKYNN